MNQPIGYALYDEQWSRFVEDDSSSTKAQIWATRAAAEAYCATLSEEGQANVVVVQVQRSE
jgi:hypothetical protein